MPEQNPDGTYKAWGTRPFANVYHRDFNCIRLEQEGVGVPVEVDPDADYNRPCRDCTRSPYRHEVDGCADCGADLDGDGECPWCAQYEAVVGD